MKKIYFSASISGGRADVDVYRQIIEHLNRYGNVLTEHIGETELSITGEIEDDATIYNRDLRWLAAADAVIAEYNPFFATFPQSMPVSIFVDANGVVTFVQVGPLRLSQMEEAFALTLASAPVATTESAGSETGS